MNGSYTIRMSARNAILLELSSSLDINVVDIFKMLGTKCADDNMP